MKDESELVNEIIAEGKWRLVMKLKMPITPEIEKWLEKCRRLLIEDAKRKLKDEK